MRLERKLLAATLLSTMFMNAGNFGLSVVLFAFGENSLAYSVTVFCDQQCDDQYSRGDHRLMGSANLRQALSTLLSCRQWMP